MKDLSIYFQPVSNDYLATHGLGSQLSVHTEGLFPELKSKGIALLYVPE